MILKLGLIGEGPHGVFRIVGLKRGGAVMIRYDDNTIESRWGHGLIFYHSEHFEEAISRGEIMMYEEQTLELLFGERWNSPTRTPEKPRRWWQVNNPVLFFNSWISATCAAWAYAAHVYGHTSLASISIAVAASCGLTAITMRRG